jgi:hypothetical protein
MKTSSYILIALVVIAVASVLIQWNIKPAGRGQVAPTATRTPVVTPPHKAVGALTGHITISPTCPVERIPPDPACAPKPFPVLLTISGPGGFFIQVHSDMNGMFLLYPPAGTYNLMTHQTTLWPRCDATMATVTVGATTTVDISCDSGIR